MWDGNRTGDAWYVADLLVVKALQEYVCPLPLTKDAMMVRKTELAVRGVLESGGGARSAPCRAADAGPVSASS